MPQPEKKARNAEIRTRVAAGERAVDLAGEYGVSGSRIGHIVRVEHFRARIKAQRLPRRSTCERCGADSPERHHPNYAEPMVVVWLCKRCHADEHAVPRVSDAELLAELRRLAEVLGRTPGMNDVRRLSKHDPVTMWERFGSYREACRLAGLEPNTRGRPSRSRCS